MNFRERGLTIGDLLLILIFIISTVFILNNFKDNNKQTNNYISPSKISIALKN